MGSGSDRRDLTRSWTGGCSSGQVPERRVRASAEPEGPPVRDGDWGGWVQGDPKGRRARPRRGLGAPPRVHVRHPGGPRSNASGSPSRDPRDKFLDPVTGTGGQAPRRRRSAPRSHTWLHTLTSSTPSSGNARAAYAARLRRSTASWAARWIWTGGLRASEPAGALASGRARRWRLERRLLLGR